MKRAVILSCLFCLFCLASAWTQAPGEGRKPGPRSVSIEAVGKSTVKINSKGTRGDGIQYTCELLDGRKLRVGIETIPLGPDGDFVVFTSGSFQIYNE